MGPNREAGITDYDWIHWYREHPVEDDLKRLKWSDEQCGAQAHVTWYPFRHPQLGMVELGGWDRLNFWRNPPPHLREREVARFPEWLTSLALALPKLELLRAEDLARGKEGLQRALRRMAFEVRGLDALLAGGQRHARRQVDLEHGAARHLALQRPPAHITRQVAGIGDGGAHAPGLGAERARPPPTALARCARK